MAEQKKLPNFPNFLVLVLIFGVLLAILIYTFYSRQPKNNFPNQTPISNLTPTATPFQSPPSLSSPASEPQESFDENLIVADFSQLISQLTTPEKLVKYLNKNFILVDRESDLAISPEDFLKKKEINRADIASFSSFVLTRNGIFSTIMRYKFLDKNGKESIKTITLFREEKDLPKFIDFENSQLKIFPAGNSPMELLSLEEQRYNIKITEYAAFNFGTTDLSKGDWLKK